MTVRVNEFYILDFDRTLADTDAIYCILETVLKEHDVDVAMLNEARAKEEASGGSFETVDYLHALFKKQSMPYAWLAIERDLVKRAQMTDVLNPGARELMARLDSRLVPYGILTYGNEAWQLAKLEAAGLLRIGHLVTRIKEKGTILKGWRTQSGTFMIPPALTQDNMGYEAASIVFLDDKAVSFKDIPAGVQGIHVTSPDGKVLPSQAGVVSSQVKTVVGVHGAIELLFGPREGTLGIDKT